MHPATAAKTGKTGEEGAEGDGKTVTAQQRVGIEVHDCTSPDVWVAFQEGAGTVDMAATEEELRNTMASIKIVENKGRPFFYQIQDFENRQLYFHR